VSAPTEEQIRATIFQVLSEIAPELDPLSIKPDKPLREQVDLDSFDFLNVIIALHERLGVEIPESDYEQLRTLAGMVKYLTEQVVVQGVWR
jgi:acyl carrier protein